jgi:hypothetical protein
VWRQGWWRVLFVSAQMLQEKIPTALQS